jgi:CHAD domain-containing protein
MTDPLVDSYYLFGLEALQERLPALAQEIEGVRAAEDIEYVHRMRVASRRVRNALALFGDDLPKKHYDSWRVDLRRITRALGAARDTDVQIAWVEDFSNRTADAELRVGIERLLLRLRQQRAQLQVKVVETLDRVQNKHVLDDMYETLHELLVHGRVYEIESLPVDLSDRARAAIVLRLEEFLAYEPHIAHPERVTELHHMRIAAKHLRYTLEIFEPLYGKGLRKPLKVVKEIQEQLGEIHDSDVWMAFMPQFIAEERARTLDYFGDATSAEAFMPGLQALVEERRQSRMKTYYVFRHFWDLTKDMGMWDRIRHAVRLREPEVLFSPDEADSTQQVPD